MPLVPPTVLESAIKGAIPSNIACDIQNLLLQSIGVTLCLDKILKAANTLTKDIFDWFILWLVWRPGDNAKRARPLMTCHDGVIHQWSPVCAL